MGISTAIQMLKSPIIDESTQEASFVLHALLNPNILRVLLPSNCLNTKITKVSQSILETIELNSARLFASEAQGWSHTISKPIRCLLRMVYLEICVNFVVPVSLLYHVSICAVSIGRFGIGKYQHDLELSNQAITELRRHVDALYMDAALYFGYRIFNWYCGICQLPSYKTLFQKSICYLLDATWCSELKPITFLAVVRILPALVVSCNYVKYVAKMFFNNRSGLYLSLELYNLLGITGANGLPLPYNFEDNMRLEIPERYPLGQFALFVDTYAVSLVRDVKKALSILNEQPDETCFPYNGYALAKKLKKSLQSQTNASNTSSHSLSHSQETVTTWAPSMKSKTLDLIKKLETGQMRLDILSRIFDDCHLISKYGHLTLFNRAINPCFARLKLSLTKERYWQELNPVTEEGNAAVDISNSDIAALCNISVPDNDHTQFVRDLFQRLKNVKEQREQGEVFSISNDISQAVYDVLQLDPKDDEIIINRKRKKYCLHLHFDKNPKLDRRLYDVIVTLFEQLISRKAA